MTALRDELTALIAVAKNDLGDLSPDLLGFVRDHGPALLAALYDAERYQRLVAWLDSNTTFYDVDADWPVDTPNVPTLAQVSNRIWYHATDDCTSYPFSAVAKSATGETQPIAPAIDAARKP